MTGAEACGLERESATQTAGSDRQKVLTHCELKDRGVALRIAEGAGTICTFCNFWCTASTDHSSPSVIPSSPNEEGECGILVSLYHAMIGLLTTFPKADTEPVECTCIPSYYLTLVAGVGD
jgi:hypothetical protein